MFKSLQTPYLTPEPSLVSVEPWHVLYGDDRVELPEFLDFWSQGTSIRLSRVIEIDRERMLDQCGLPADTELAVAVSWISDTTKIRRRVFRAPITDEPLNVTPTLNGDEAGGKVAIRTSIILGSSISFAKPWVAHEVGSVLLVEKRDLSLDRGESGFPMTVVDFAHTHYPPEASWHLETTTSLEARFTSSFQVLVNDRDVKLVKAMEAEKPTKEQALLLDNLMSGVMIETLKLAYSLRRNGDLELEGYEYGSVGEVLANLVKRTGDQPVDVSADPARWSLMRTQFEEMARTIGVGRVL